MTTQKSDTGQTFFAFFNVYMPPTTSQKAIFYTLKDGQRRCKRPPFAALKAVFYIVTKVHVFT